MDNDERSQMREIATSLIAEQATGCDGAGDYYQNALEKEFDRVISIDTASSSGDWFFIVRKKGTDDWYGMWQENNWPRAGFSYYYTDNPYFIGSRGDVVQYVCKCLDDDFPMQEIIVNERGTK